MTGRRRRIERGFLGIAISLLVTGLAACSVGPSGSASPSPTSTPTLNPNQLELLRRSADPSPAGSRAPSPASSPTALPRPTPTLLPVDSALEAMLPSSLRGVPLQRFSNPASTFANGGDVCVVLCPDEPGRLAAAAGKGIQDLTVGSAIPAQTADLKVGVIAIRFPGIDTATLVGIRLKAGGHTASSPGQPPDSRNLRIGRRTVVWVTWPPFYAPGQGEYLLASGDVLFIVAGPPPMSDGSAPADVVLAVDALP